VEQLRNASDRQYHNQNAWSREQICDKFVTLRSVSWKPASFGGQYLVKQLPWRQHNKCIEPEMPHEANAQSLGGT